MLKSRDVRAVYRLLGEIRVLGDQPDRWPMYALDGIRQLLGAKYAGGAVVPLPKPGSDGKVEAEINMFLGVEGETLDRVIEANRSGAMAGNVYFKRLLAKPQRFRTVRRQDVISDEEFYAHPDSKTHFLDHGVDHMLHSQFLALSIGKVVSIILLRAIGEPPFDERERRMLRLFHMEMARMWRTDLAVPDDFQIRELPARQKQVLYLLCSGQSEKQIAAKLDISQHTVHDYVKALYKHFEVAGRNELLIKVLRHPQRSLGTMAMPGKGYHAQVTPDDENPKHYNLGSLEN